MKNFGYFMSVVIFLFGILTMIGMMLDGVESNYTYLIPSIFLLIGILLFLMVRFEKNDFYD